MDYEAVATTLLVELAPPPPGDQKHTRLSLGQHLFPKFSIFDLDIIDEKLLPRRIFSDKPPCRPSFRRFDEPFLDDLEEWTHL